MRRDIERDRYQRLFVDYVGCIRENFFFDGRTAVAAGREVGSDVRHEGRHFGHRFMLPGHSKFGPDRLFGNVSTYLLRREHFSDSELVELIQQVKDSFGNVDAIRFDEATFYDCKSLCRDLGYRSFGGIALGRELRYNPSVPFGFVNQTIDVIGRIQRGEQDKRIFQNERVMLQRVQRLYTAHQPGIGACLQRQLVAFEDHAFNGAPLVNASNELHFWKDPKGIGGAEVPDDQTDCTQQPANSFPAAASAPETVARAPGTAARAPGTAARAPETTASAPEMTV